MYSYSWHMNLLLKNEDAKLAQSNVYIQNGCSLSIENLTICFDTCKKNASFIEKRLNRSKDWIDNCDWKKDWSCSWVYTMIMCRMHKIIIGTCAFMGNHKKTAFIRFARCINLFGIATSNFILSFSHFRLFFSLLAMTWYLN